MPHTHELVKALCRDKGPHRLGLHGIDDVRRVVAGGRAALAKDLVQIGCAEVALLAQII